MESWTRGRLYVDNIACRRFVLSSIVRQLQLPVPYTIPVIYSYEFVHTPTTSTLLLFGFYGNTTAPP
eukprot:scaffold1117_cov167-Amphora_coffeaeformis.AAC.20